MIDTIKPKVLIRSLLITALMLMTLAWCAPDASAQTGVPPRQTDNTTATDDEAAGTDAATGPACRDYKGVRIGMSAEEVSQKLGKPELKDDTQDAFVVSDIELVQVVYDKDGRVSAVSITYSGKNDAVPSAVAVLGEDVAAAADGRVYKLVRYPNVGYWVAYIRTAGNAPVVSVTMKKMRVIPK